MLARTHRFMGHRSVRAVLKSGVSVRQGLFTLRLASRLCPEGYDCPSRAGVVVSRRTAKSAVVRNRLRRRIYGSLGKHWTDVPSSIDLVVIVHDAKLSDLSSSELSDALLQTIKTALTKLNPPAAS